MQEGQACQASNHLCRHQPLQAFSFSPFSICPSLTPTPSPYHSSHRQFNTIPLLRLRHGRGILPIQLLRYCACRCPWIIASRGCLVSSDRITPGLHPLPEITATTVRLVFVTITTPCLLFQPATFHTPFPTPSDFFNQQLTGHV